MTTNRDKIYTAALTTYATNGTVATLATLGEMTGVRYQHVGRAMHELVDEGRLVRVDGGYVPADPHLVLALAKSVEELDAEKVNALYPHPLTDDYDHDLARYGAWDGHQEDPPVEGILIGGEDYVDWLVTIDDEGDYVLLDCSRNNAVTAVGVGDIVAHLIVSWPDVDGPGDCFVKIETTDDRPDDDTIWADLMIDGLSEADDAEIYDDHVYLAWDDARPTAEALDAIEALPWVRGLVTGGL